MGSTQNWEAQHMPGALRRVNQARANAYAEPMSKQDIRHRRLEAVSMWLGVEMQEAIDAHTYHGVQIRL